MEMIKDHEYIPRMILKKRYHMYHILEVLHELEKNKKYFNSLFLTIAIGVECESSIIYVKSQGYACIPKKLKKNKSLFWHWMKVILEPRFNTHINYARRRNGKPWFKKPQGSRWLPYTEWLVNPISHKPMRARLLDRIWWVFNSHRCLATRNMASKNGS